MSQSPQVPPNPYGGEVPFSPPYGMPSGQPIGVGVGRPPLRRPSGLATAAIVLAIAYTALEVLQAGLAVQAAPILKEAAALGLTYNDSPFTAYDAAMIPTIPLGIALYVVACLWLQKSRAFAVAANPQAPHRRSTVWAWLGWWVPIVSFWFPFQVVSDVRNATARTAIGARYGIWWSVWVVWLVLDRVESNLLGGSTGGSVLNESGVAMVAPLSIISATLFVLGCVLWISIISEIARAQREHLHP